MERISELLPEEDVQTPAWEGILRGSVGAHIQKLAGAGSEGLLGGMEV